MKRLLVTIFLLLQIFPYTANAADIPLLTWERGREQQIVLASQDNRELKIRLEGEAGSFSDFTASKANDKGLRVYTAQIPSDFPTGGYLIRVSRDAGFGTTLAGVTIVEAVTVTPASSLRDLSLLLAFFVFITATYGVLRGRKYAHLTVSTIESDYLENRFGLKAQRFSAKNALSKILIARISSMVGMNNSLLKYLMMRNSNFAASKAMTSLALFPLFAVGIGIFAGFAVPDVTTLYSAGSIYLGALIVISIFDVYSGLLGFIALSAVHVILGEVASIRDVILVVTLSLTALLAPLLADFFSQGVATDFFEARKANANIVKLINAALTLLYSAVIYYFGLSLFDSLVYTNAGLSISWLFAIFAFALLTTSKSLLGSDSVTGENFQRREIPRLISPFAAFLLNIGVAYYLYAWTDQFDLSILASLMFAVPYYLLVLKLERGLGRPGSKRLALVEPLALSSIVGFIYNQVQDQPVLGDSRTTILLVFVGIVLVAHAAFCLAKSSSEKVEAQSL